VVSNEVIRKATAGLAFVVVLTGSIAANANNCASDLSCEATTQTASNAPAQQSAPDDHSYLPPSMQGSKAQADSSQQTAAEQNSRPIAQRTALQKPRVVVHRRHRPSGDSSRFDWDLFD